MMFFRYTLDVVLALLLATLPVTAFWRLNCGIVQLSRTDPILSPGQASGHVHVLVGGNTVNSTSNYNSLRASVCSSCTVQADKSAYWTPLLYYMRKDGTFVDVPNGGIIVYYLGRGQGTPTPFPPGFRMISGNVGLRSYNSTYLTYGNSNYPNRPIADRVSFNCVNYNDPQPETNGLPNSKNLSCPDGLRAQIQFQSCWDGVNLYKPDQSHVAYLSQIDNGICPPGYPVLLPHLFYEIYYSISQIDTSDHGTFLFSSGDETGYGFHGDFMNGWDPKVLSQAVSQCIASTGGGTVEECAPFAPSIDELSANNCPLQPSLVAEQVTGNLRSLPGRNPPTRGPAYVPQILSAAPLIAPNTATNNQIRKQPTPNVSTLWLGGPTAVFKGCYVDSVSRRVLSKAFFTDYVNMYNQLCGLYCDVQGFTVFGTEYGGECYCGTALPKQIANLTDCDMVCDGDLANYCGGPNRLTVWQVKK